MFSIRHKAPNVSDFLQSAAPALLLVLPSKLQPRSKLDDRKTAVWKHLTHECNFTVNNLPGSELMAVLLSQTTPKLEPTFWAYEPIQFTYNEQQMQKHLRKPPAQSMLNSCSFFKGQTFLTEVQADVEAGNWKQTFTPAGQPLLMFC